MSTTLDRTTITNAQNAVDTYVTKVTALYQRLDAELATLTANNFIGEGSMGYKSFYNASIVPSLTTVLTDPNQSLTATIKSMLAMVENTLMDQVDPQLGESNRNVFQQQQ